MVMAEDVWISVCKCKVMGRNVRIGNSMKSLEGKTSQTLM